MPSIACPLIGCLLRLGSQQFRYRLPISIDLLRANLIALNLNEGSLWIGADRLLQLWDFALVFRQRGYPIARKIGFQKSVELVEAAAVVYH
jgi:hypothetical protein